MILPVVVGDLELGMEQHPIAQSGVLQLQFHWNKSGSLPGDFSAKIREVNLRSSKRDGAGFSC